MNSADVYILGINCNIHQSSAALIKNGILVAAAEEERFSRRKYDSRFPALAIAYCLKEAGISINEVAYAGFYWQPWKGLAKRIWWLMRYFPASLETFKGHKKWRGSVNTLWEHLAVPGKLRGLGFKGKFYFLDHHMTHAASAFYLSPFESAAIFTTDLCGEDCTTLFALGQGNRIIPRKRAMLPHSLGIFYAALTQFLGYEANGDEYKVMGLAPYGAPKYRDVFSQMVRFEQGTLVNDSSWFAFHLGGDNCYSDRFIKEFGPPCESEEQVETGIYKDLAASGQKALEELMIKMARWCKEETGESNLCMAGGVALNSVANGKLWQEHLFDDIWVQPAAYDPGCTIGIPYFIWHQVLNQPRSFMMEHAYWGPQYGVDEMEAAAARLDYRRSENVERETAKLLADGNVIGWFQGRMEWGPRALGNRSILADPRKAEMKDVINAKIKFREPYRPFAPSVLEEEVETYFEFKGPSPYMVFVCPVKEDRRQEIPAVTHIDNSARIQTVSKKHNPRYWNLIHEFKKVTGVGVVLNTSFNVKGEPIVCSPDDAVKCFLNTDMDYLILGDLICKRKQP